MVGTSKDSFLRLRAVRVKAADKKAQGEFAPVDAAWESRLETRINAAQAQAQMAESLVKALKVDYERKIGDQRIEELAPLYQNRASLLQEFQKEKCDRAREASELRTELIQRCNTLEASFARAIRVL